MILGTGYHSYARPAPPNTLWIVIGIYLVPTSHLARTHPDSGVLSTHVSTWPQQLTSRDSRNRYIFSINVSLVSGIYLSTFQPLNARFHHGRVL